MSSNKPWMLLPVAAILAGVTAWGVVCSRKVNEPFQSDPSGSPGVAHRITRGSASNSSAGRAEPVAPDSPEVAKAKAAANRGMNIVTVRAMVSSLIDVAEQGDRQAAENSRKAIARYGSIAKEVLSEVLEHRVLSEIARNELRSVYEQIP